MGAGGSTLGSARRVLAAQPLVRRVVRHPRVEPAVAAVLRSRAVRESPRFVARELLHRRGLVRYRVRGSGRAVFIRHGGADTATLDEILYTRHYEPPPEIERALGGHDPHRRIVDLGANIGLFEVFAADRFGWGRAVAFEPDPENAAVLRRCLEANGWTDRVELIEACAAPADGRVAFETGGQSLSRMVEDGAAGASVLPAVDALPFLRACDLLKMDIEGGEWAILADPRFAAARVGVVVLEYHPHLCPKSDPRAAATRLLEAAGYRVIPIFHTEDGHGMTWALRA